MYFRATKKRTTRTAKHKPAQNRQNGARIRVLKDGAQEGRRALGGETKAEAGSNPPEETAAGADRSGGRWKETRRRRAPKWRRRAVKSASWLVFALLVLATTLPAAYGFGFALGQSVAGFR